MNRLQRFLLELGQGFAFVGRQVRLDVAGDDFYIDLLFFHVEQLRYVVLELKVGKFAPGYIGQLGFYIAVVDDKLCRSKIHRPTVGILLCADRNNAVVRYALSQAASPMAVSGYNFDELPQDEQHSVRDAVELNRALDAPVEYDGKQMTFREYFAKQGRQWLRGRTDDLS
jgi:hypothetical protein